VAGDYGDSDHGGGERAMTDENKYSPAMQTAFENAMIDAGMPLDESTHTELFDTVFDKALQTARWFAERKDVLYRHLTLCETRTLDEWREFWHAMEDSAPFRRWVCENLDRASYEAALFTVTTHDAQNMARELKLGKITDEQMERVKAWVNDAFDDWADILGTAVVEAKKELEV